MKPYDLPFPPPRPLPADPLEAVTHADPYPYYDTLAARPGLGFEPRLGLWVAASAASVAQVMLHADCRPWPDRARGMTTSAVAWPADAAAATPAMPAVAPAGVDLDAHALASIEIDAHALAGVEIDAHALAASVGRRLWRADASRALATWVSEVPAAVLAALAAARAGAPRGLPALMRDATAGLIGSSVLALARQPEDERSGPEDAAALVRAVSRFDPPVQNTRRLVTRHCEIGGAPLRAGDTILLVLAAANRDPLAPGRCFGFGAATQACAAHALACALAAGALEALMESIATAPEAALLPTLAWTYRRSRHARIPEFG